MTHSRSLKTLAAGLSLDKAVLKTRPWEVGYMVPKYWFTGIYLWPRISKQSENTARRLRH